MVIDMAITTVMAMVTTMDRTKNNTKSGEDCMVRFHSEGVDE